MPVRNCVKAMRSIALLAITAERVKGLVRKASIFTRDVVSKLNIQAEHRLISAISALPPEPELPL